MKSCLGIAVRWTCCDLQVKARGEILDGASLCLLPHTHPCPDLLAAPSLLYSSNLGLKSRREDELLVLDHDEGI
jgi:hypothetical protein